MIPRPAHLSFAMEEGSESSTVAAASVTGMDGWMEDGIMVSSSEGKADDGQECRRFGLSPPSQIPQGDSWVWGKREVSSSWEYLRYHLRLIII